MIVALLNRRRVAVWEMLDYTFISISNTRIAVRSPLSADDHSISRDSLAFIAEFTSSCSPSSVRRCTASASSRVDGDDTNTKRRRISAVMAWRGNISLKL